MLERKFACMPGRGEVGKDLHYEREGSRLRIWSDAVWPELSLWFMASGGRVRSGALLLDGDHLTDLSGQPSAIVRMIGDTAVAAGVRAESWCARTAALLRTVFRGVAHVTDRNAAVTEADDLVGLIGGLRFPALALAYDFGARVEPEVPRWARAGLEHAEPMAIALGLFGAKATRSVARALADAFAHSCGRVAWSSLGVAVAGADVLVSDEIARLVRYLQGDEARIMSVDDVGLVRWAASFLGRATFMRLVEQVLRDERLPHLLQTCTTMYGARQVMHRPFPSRIDELHRVALAASVIDTRPLEPPAAPVERSDMQPVTINRRHLTARPTPVEGARRRTHVFRHPHDVAELGGVTIGALSLDVPRHQGELVVWSQVLRNCLADFGVAIDTGRSVVIGVRQEGVLLGALELDQHRRLRQFLGAHNRRLPVHVTTAVMTELVRRGVAVA